MLTNARNHAFQSATPINHTSLSTYCIMQFRLRMLKLSLGKCHQFKFSLLNVACSARRLCALESSSWYYYSLWSEVSQLCCTSAVSMVINRQADQETNCCNPCTCISWLGISSYMYLAKCRCIWIQDQFILTSWDSHTLNHMNSFPPPPLLAISEVSLNFLKHLGSYACESLTHMSDK